ncbi:MAG: hypothetical protein QM621_11820 [Aeromicrobium sp.]|uniref:hypothetical protein n=1 Tax=Aeromicrobium sp. TaxID=1871063 RepID=UPI0039E43D2D
MEFSELMRPPDTLYSIREVADRLGMSKMSAALLVVSGVGGPCFHRHDRRDIESVLTPSATLEKLANTPWLTEHPEALVVRVRPARRDPNDAERSHMGWLPGASWEDHEAAVGRWWRIKDPDQWHGKTLVAAVVGYVAHVATITDHETTPGGAVAFQLTPPEDRTLAAFEGRRMTITQGGVTLHLPASPDWNAA